MDPIETNSPQRTLTVEKLVYGGDGLARDNGQVTLLPLVLPGERVEAAIIEKKPQIQRARLHQVLEASPDRIFPPCPHFGPCGGCHYQHIRYPAQIEQKLAILRETLQRIGRIPPPDNIGVISGPEFGYRNRIQLHLDGRNVGYHEMGSKELRDVEACPIASPKLNQTLAAIRTMARDRRWPNFLQTIELFTNETEVQVNVLAAAKPVARRFFDWCATDIPGFLNGSLDYTAAGIPYRVSADAFFQVNRFLVDPLVEAALDGAEGAAGLDLYSGAGLFALPLGRRVEKVTAVESGASAIRDLQYNATRVGLTIDAVQSQVETYLRAQSGPWDFVLADPPRTGLGKHATQALLALRPRKLHIVSCDPATLARDLAVLLPAYDLDSLTLVDLFPQTFHIETLAKLRLKP